MHYGNYAAAGNYGGYGSYTRTAELQLGRASMVQRAAQQQIAAKVAAVSQEERRETEQV